MQLFWSKGYESASLQDLLETMGLSRSSFYQTFGNKHQLFERCVVRYRDAMVGSMHDQLERAHSARQFIEQMFYQLAKEARGSGHRRGCLVMNSASEFADRDAVVADLIAESKDAFIGVLETVVARAQREGDIPADKDARALARYLFSSMTGMKIVVKAGASQSEVKEIVSITLQALD